MLYRKGRIASDSLKCSPERPSARIERRTYWIPLFMLTEVWAHRELPPIVRRFVLDRLIPPARTPQFDAAIESATRWRNSVAAELLLLAFVYGVGVAVLWRTQFLLEVNTWYASTDGGQLRPTLAGRWMALVSMPIFLFLLLRWCFRLLIWTRFLWQVSRLDLDLEAAHPDGMAGLLRDDHRARLQAFPAGVRRGAVGNDCQQDSVHGRRADRLRLEIVGTVILEAAVHQRHLMGRDVEFEAKPVRGPSV